MPPGAGPAKGDTMSIKIAIVGAGSAGFTRSMIGDILSVPELRGARIALTDTSRRNLGAGK
jgi:alpha-galactosidase